MTFLTISDVHIKESGDKSEKLLINFLELALEKKVEKVFLLGDIFDLMVGGHLLYQESYPNTFKAIEKVLKAGIRVIQLEGNHDFHFKKLITMLLKQWGLEVSVWEYLTAPSVEEINGHRFLFAHGDEIELGNESYKRYRKFIRSGFINFLANYVVSPRFTRSIGQNASHKSRERNTERYSEMYEEEKVRPLFRESAQLAAKRYNVNTVICGHSHCYDEFSQDNFQYFNNGFLPRTKKCFYFDGEGVKPLDLSSGS